MKTFNDAAGRTWTISLTLGSAMRVKDALGISLLDLDQGVARVGDKYRMVEMKNKADAEKHELLSVKLVSDKFFLADVLFCLLEPQIEKHGLTKDNAWDAFNGETMLAMNRALYEELTDFFQSSGRTNVVRLIEAQAKVVNAQMKVVDRMADKLTDETMEKVVVGVMSGESPERLASTLGLTR